MRWGGSASPWCACERGGSSAVPQQDTDPSLFRGACLLHPCVLRAAQLSCWVQAGRGMTSVPPLSSHAWSVTKAGCQNELQKQSWLVLRFLGFCGESILQSMPLLVILCWLNEAACIFTDELLQVSFLTVCFCRGRTGCLIPARSTGQCLISSCGCAWVCTASPNQHSYSCHLQWGGEHLSLPKTIQEGCLLRTFSFSNQNPMQIAPEFSSLT